MISTTRAGIALAGLGVAAAVAAAFVLMPGGSDSAGPDAATSPSARDTAAEAAWRAEACSAVRTLRSARRAQPTDILDEIRLSEGPAQARALALDYLDRVEARLAPVLTALDRPGAPADITAANGEIAEARAKLVEARGKITTANPADPQALATAVGMAVYYTSGSEALVETRTCPES